MPAGSGRRGVLVWKWPVHSAGLSSAPVGGGLGRVEWAINIGVASDYGRTDLSNHAGEIAAVLGLRGAGAAMFTAVDLSRLISAEREGVSVDATVGISHPTWAADPAEASPRPAGTNNLVVQVPVALDPGAAFNAVITATEAKAQALGAGGLPGTGTATDALFVVWPVGGTPEPFAGPRSEWGSRIGRAVYEAVWTGSGPQN